jgi:hypothetical protein
MPCATPPASFAFASAASKIFAPSGSAAVTGAGWTLPVVPTENRAAHARDFVHGGSRQLQ